MKEQTKAGAVLPKRRPDREHYMTVPEYGSGYDAGWNACLDALASTPQPPPEQAGSVEVPDGLVSVTRRYGVQGHAAVLCFRTDTQADSFTSSLRNAIAAAPAPKESP